MAEQKRYTVHRSMHGDGKDYEAGDTRLMAEADAAELVKLVPCLWKAKNRPPANRPCATPSAPSRAS